MDTTLTPTRGYCLIEPILEQEVSQAGIVIPDEVQKRQARGKVIRLGIPNYDPKGNLDLIEVSTNDIVWFKQFAGEPVKDRGKDYLMVPYTSILGIYK